MRSLAALVFFCLHLATCIGLVAAHDTAAHRLARRHGSMSFPGRVFGANRWGVVLEAVPKGADSPDGNGPADDTSSSILTDSATPAVNPANEPSYSAESAPPPSPTVLTIPPSSNTESTPTSSATPSSSSSSSPDITAVQTPTTNKAVFTPTRSTQSTTSAATSTTTTTTTEVTSSTPVESSSSSEETPAKISHFSTVSSVDSSSDSDSSSSSESSTSSAAPASTTASTESVPASGSGEAAYLAAHNNERAKHGAAALTWSGQLESAAQEWANRCKFNHSGGVLGPFGENLAAGTGNFDATDAVGTWNAEQPSYDPSNPQFSHWTQVVWKSTKQVGCAVARNCAGIFPGAVAEYHVCEYFPAGNVIGEFPQNVQD